jgi:hypothetical protein
MPRRRADDLRLAAAFLVVASSVCTSLATIAALAFAISVGTLIVSAYGASTSLPAASEFDPSPELEAELRDRLLRAGEARAGSG